MVARPSLVVPVCAAAGFLVLLALTIVDWTPLNRVDAAVSDAFRAYGDHSSGLVAVVRVATDFVATVPFVATGLVVGAALAVRGERRPALLCVAVTILVPLLWGLMHWLVHHPRPEDGFVTVTSNGFPSGHTSNAAAAALVAVHLIWPRSNRRVRLVTLGLAAAFALLAGLTRVFLVVHWPTDVLGGWLLALAVVPATARLLAGGVPQGRDRLVRSRPGPAA
ncbi:phosphatase PAP2 family protein [Micromonospora sp. HM5-17]|jgi:undecaprenyl-diphosphatase|uniref:phosphatase PAP2 family protein n=1 Tax=Micromonospora sp. HM5-17 TaxID=2487710 RepID=UPI000F49FF78|nr:phosphatase PAP2 family protein [Micromonospora sp. HM5-17]ROT26839.1 phosphatase PAP2 family protein [Micromonospora sp. HM5-17]